MYDFSLINTRVYVYGCLLSSKTDFHIQCCKIKMNYTFNIIFLNQKKYFKYIHYLTMNYMLHSKKSSSCMLKKALRK